MKKSNIRDIITYEIFKTEYIDNNLMIKEIANKYGFTEDQVSALNCKHYKLKKSKEAHQQCIERSNIEKYGISHISKLDTVKEKKKNTNLEKYGVENPMQRDEIKQKNINNKVYSHVEHTDAEKQIIYEKYKATMKEKYGVINPYQLESVKEKIKQTNLEKYGVDNPMKNANIKQKAIKTNIERYGASTSAKNKDIIEKMKKSRAKTISEHKMEYMKKIYQNLDIDPKYVEIFSSRENFRKWIMDEFNGKCTNYDIQKKTNMAESTISKYIIRYDSYDMVEIPRSTSSFEKEICEYISTLGIDHIEKNKYGLIPNYEIDIYIPAYKIGIEVNGNYWHSDAFKEKQYHQNKSLLAEQNGIRLIHIYEYEWENLKTQKKIKSLLKIALNSVENRIYARNCQIKKISNNEAKEFNDNNHIQGHRNAQITYGLYYNDELVQLMSFSKHEKYEWEIIRGCPGSNNIVVGGVGRLFKKFISENSPNTVFSYCDFNKFDGKSYEAIGMNFIGLTGPDLKYIDNSGNVFNRNPKRYQENKNLNKIYGAGSKKYLWTKEKTEN